MGKNGTNHSGDKEKKIKRVEMSDTRKRKFYKTFGSKINDGETLINYFSCALIADILLQGHLYISENYFCFYSNVLGYVTKLVIPISSVTAITREKTAKMFPNAIGICSSTLTNNSQIIDSKHTFGSFLSRESAFNLMYGMVRKPICDDVRSEEIDTPNNVKEETLSDSSKGETSLDTSSISGDSITQVNDSLIDENVQEVTVESPSNYLLIVGIVITILLLILSTFLLRKIYSLEARRLDDVAGVSEDAEQALERNLRAVKHLRYKLEELQTIVGSFVRDSYSKEL